MREIAAPEKNMPVLPPALHPGDTIGLFCPSGPVRNREYVRKGIECLQDSGFQVKIAENLQEEPDPDIYLAAPDDIRAQRLRDLWLDDEVKALMAIRGGYGCLRILHLLDFSLFYENPKLLIGFSDVTTLLAAIFKQTGVIGLHGPVVSTLSKVDRLSRRRLFALITGEYLPCPVNDVEILRHGTGTGQLIIGNLTTLIHLIGTPYEPRFDKAILVIEDTGESMYRIDRMLTHLSCSGKLQRLAGLILGSFDLDRDARQHLMRQILELTSDLDYPVWSNFPLGHGRKNLSLPYGMPATMGADQHLRLHVEQVQYRAGSLL